MRVNYYILNGALNGEKRLHESHWRLIVALLARLAPMCLAAQRLARLGDREVVSGRAAVQPHQARAIARVLGAVTPADIDAVKASVGRPLWDATKVLREVRAAAKFFARSGGEVRVWG